MKGGSVDEILRDQLLEARGHTIDDMTELSNQVSIGEIDEATAVRLLAEYTEELRTIDEELSRLPAPTKAPSVEITEAPGDDEPTVVVDRPPVEDRRSLWRAVTGALIVTALITVGIVWIAGDAFRGDETASSPAPGPIPAGEDLGTIDPGQLAEMSITDLTDLLEAHPESVTVRLLLADRYLEAGDNRLALEHYLIVASAAPDPAVESRASARIGYLAYVTDQREAAVEYLETAVSLDPLNGEAKLFLGMVLLYGFDDVDRAIPLLEEVAALPDLPDSIRAEVATALQDARAGPGGG